MQLCCGHKGEPVQVPKFEGIVQLHWQLIIVAEAAGVAVPFAVLVHQPVAVPKFEGESGAACLRACSRLSALLQTSHCAQVLNRFAQRPLLPCALAGSESSGEFDAL